MKHLTDGVCLKTPFILAWFLCSVTQMNCQVFSWFSLKLHFEVIRFHGMPIKVCSFASSPVSASLEIANLAQTSSPLPIAYLPCRRKTFKWTAVVQPQVPNVRLIKSLRFVVCVLFCVLCSLCCLEST